MITPPASFATPVDVPVTDGTGASPEQQAVKNALLALLMPTNTRVGTALAAFGGLPPGEYPPNRIAAGRPPIGNAGASVSNYLGTKFTRGWLSGAGGADIDQNLGSLAQVVRPAPYNSQVAAQFRGAAPKYGAPVAGLANWDVNAPGRTFSNASGALAEFLPSTYDNRTTLDIVSGFEGRTLVPAVDGITSAPEAQFNQALQVDDGVGRHLPGNSFRGIAVVNKPRMPRFGAQ